jgi:hypothetical protein
LATAGDEKTALPVAPVQSGVHVLAGGVPVVMQLVLPAAALKA